MSTAALSIPYAAALGACAFLYFVVYPVIEYFRDVNGMLTIIDDKGASTNDSGLRRYPNMHPLSGISSIPFMVLAHGGARSTYLEKLHRKHPVIRVGPNFLSYGDLRAVKDIYGHNTPCTKDGSYVITAGSHYHLADVIDKHDHARKRKLMSSAYAIKNLANGPISSHWTPLPILDSPTSLDSSTEVTIELLDVEQMARRTSVTLGQRYTTQPGNSRC